MDSYLRNRMSDGEGITFSFLTRLALNILNNSETVAWIFEKYELIEAIRNFRNLRRNPSQQLEWHTLELFENLFTTTINKKNRPLADGAYYNQYGNQQKKTYGISCQILPWIYPRLKYRNVILANPVRGYTTNSMVSTVMEIQAISPLPNVRNCAMLSLIFPNAFAMLRR